MHTSQQTVLKAASLNQRWVTSHTKVRPLAKFVVAIIAILSVATFAGAQTCPGCLDQTFAGGGAVVTATQGNPTGSTEIDSALQSNGQLVVLMNAAGTTIRNSIVRFTPDGNIDLAFGIGGFRDIVWSAPNGGIASTIVIQVVQTTSGPEERFVIAGGYPCGRNSSCLRIERYTNAGSLDATFGNNGVTTVNFSPSLCVSATQPDQKVLIACGETLVRLNANGSTDSGFGKSGISQAKPGVYIRDLYVLTNGRILGTGDTGNANSRNIVIARFNPNGSLDDGSRSDSTSGDSFGVAGKTTVSIGNNDYGLGTAVDALGNIVVVGETQIGGVAVQNYDALILRLTSTGQLDSSFGSGGKVILDIANLQDEYEAVALQSDGKILAAGEGRSGIGGADYLVARYNSDGTPDLTFGNGGWLLHDFFGNYDHAGTLFIQADPGCGGCAKLLVAGVVSVSAGDPQAPRYTGVLRLTL